MRTTTRGVVHMAHRAARDNCDWANISICLYVLRVWTMCPCRHELSWWEGDCTLTSFILGIFPSNFFIMGLGIEHLVVDLSEKA